MAITQSSTRSELRQAIGHMIGKVYVGATTSGGSTSTLIDANLRGGDDEHNGAWFVFHDGSNAGLIRRASDYVASTTTVTLAPVLAATVGSGHTYELWDRGFDPNRVNALINQGIRQLYGLFFDPVENGSLHADGRQTRFDIPSDLSMINRVMYRSTMESKVIHSCGVAWDEKTDGEFTISVDTKDYKRGAGANKFVIGDGASAGDSISDSIASKDISDCTHVEFWAKSSINVTAAYLQLQLDDSASLASALETLSLPALTADTWTRCRVALATPELDTAIISVGLKYTADIGAATVWLDDIIAMNNDTEIWNVLPSQLWSIDKEAGDLVVSTSGREVLGYSRIKLIGGNKPAELTADTTVCEVPDDFIVNWVSGMMSLSEGAGSSTDPDDNFRRGQMWVAMAEQALRGIHLPPNARLVA